MDWSSDSEALDAERLFLSVRSAVSGRHAILEDDGFALWLYLTASSNTKPIADCIVYSLMPPTEELVRPHGEGGPPVLPRRFASSVALQPSVPANAHRIQFSADGHSVAAFVRGEPWALIIHGGQRSQSKSLSAVGPFGQPWSQPIFDALFPSSRAA